MVLIRFLPVFWLDFASFVKHKTPGIGKISSCECLSCKKLVQSSSVLWKGKTRSCAAPPETTQDSVLLWGCMLMIYLFLHHSSRWCSTLFPSLGCHCKASLQILHWCREVPLPLPVEKGCSASGRHRHHTATLALHGKAEVNEKELEKQGPAVHTLSAS